jgi:hypothetical protein
MKQREEKAIDALYELFREHGIPSGKTETFVRKIFSMISEAWLEGYSEGMHDEAMARDIVKEKAK